MKRVGLPHGVHRKRPKRVDGQALEIGVIHDAGAIVRQWSFGFKRRPLARMTRTLIESPQFLGEAWARDIERREAEGAWLLLDPPAAARLS